MGWGREGGLSAEKESAGEGKCRGARVAVPRVLWPSRHVSCGLGILYSTYVGGRAGEGSDRKRLGGGGMMISSVAGVGWVRCGRACG